MSATIKETGYTYVRRLGMGYRYSDRIIWCTISLSTVKKHSTSSVVDALGCSGGMLLFLLKFRRHSRLSISLSVLTLSHE